MARYYAWTFRISSLFTKQKSCKNAKTACSSRDDQTAFVDIMSGLGRDASSVPLSCPIVSAGPWGGAMGPAQFIPSTWQLFKERIASIVGKFLPDPWDPKDAIVASAIYLGDLGAGSKSYSAEKKPLVGITGWEVLRVFTAIK